MLSVLYGEIRYLTSSQYSLEKTSTCVWQNGDQDGLVDETILEAGDFTQVKPGKVHQFEGLEDGVAFELYWAEFNHDDIVRRTVGTKT